MLAVQPEGGILGREGGVLGRRAEGRRPEGGVLGRRMSIPPIATEARDVASPTREEYETEYAVFIRSRVGVQPDTWVLPEGALVYLRSSAWRATRTTSTRSDDGTNDGRKIDDG
jgi:hypothetical protein